MGPTDDVVTYPGWNIDDVLVLGTPAPWENWMGGVNNHWENPANWSAGFCPGVQTAAAFAGAPAIPPPTLYQAQSVKGVDFRVAGCTVGGSGYTLTVGSDGIDSSGAGTNTINPAVMLAYGSTWTVGAGNTLGLTGTLNGGGYPLTRDGAGTLILSGAKNLGGLNLTSGKTTLANGGKRVIVSQGLSIDPANAVLDLADNGLIVDYSGGTPGDPSPALSSVKQWIASGYNAMSWTGGGITSSAAALAPNTHGLGYAQNNMLFAPYNSFAGQPVDSNCVLVKYTFAGDLNLDGRVDDNDVAILGLFYDGGATTSHYWSQGDLFGYDGRIDDNDVSILGLTYGKGIGAPLSEGTPATAVMAPVRPAVDVAPPPGVLGTAPTAPVFEADVSSLATPDDDSSMLLLSTAPRVGAAPVTFLPAFTLPQLDGSVAMLTVSSPPADGVPLVFGGGDEVAPSSSEPALAPDAEILDPLALSALAL
jgi:hypothetical protein